MEIYVNGSQNNNGTWIDLSGYPQDITNGTSADNYRIPYLIPLLNRDMYILLFKGCSSPKGRYYTQSNDTWEEVESISTRNAKTLLNTNCYELWSISTVVDAMGHIHLVFLDEDNNIVYCRRDYHLNTWVTSDEIVLVSNVPDYATPQIAIDYSTGNLYVYYVKADEHVYMLRKINWIWDIDWIDFLDMSDIGIGYNLPESQDGCLSISRRVVNNNIIVLTMGDDPRVIRHKVYEIDKVIFTWNNKSRSTPWKQSSIISGSTITTVMPDTFGELDWWKWDDDDPSQSKAILMNGNYLFTGYFKVLDLTVSLSEGLQLTDSKYILRLSYMIKKVFAIIPRKAREEVFLEEEDIEIDSEERSG